MDSYLIRGILIGLLFGMPIGAVGTMTVQRTLKHGFKAGLVTGLGSSAADCLYACIGAFGLTIISDFLLAHQTMINIFGGALVMVMGIRLFVRKEEASVPVRKVSGSIQMFLSSFAVGITNPAAVLTFLFAFSYFGITKEAGWAGGIQLVAGVFVGTYLWWGLLSAAVSFIKKAMKNRSFPYMNKVFGTILILFGIAVYIKIIL